VPTPISGENIEWFALPHDSGLSKGRNELLKRVKTKYFVLLDDDFVFTSQTEIKYFVSIMEHTNLDICGGEVFNYKENKMLSYFANFDVRKDGTHLVQVPTTHKPESNVRFCELILNFFIARTDTVLQMGGWDPDLKVAEHTDFFFRCKKAGIHVGYTPTVIVNHSQARPKESVYVKYRMRGRQFTDLMIHKQNLTTLTNVHGDSTYRPKIT
jgi:GT2 family glycosyltransferase